MKLEFTLALAALLAGCSGESIDRGQPTPDPTCGAAGDAATCGLTVYRAPTWAACIRVEAPPNSSVSLDFEPATCGEAAGRAVPESGCFTVPGPASPEDHTFGEVYATEACVTFFEDPTVCGC